MALTTVEGNYGRGDLTFPKGKIEFRPEVVGVNAGIVVTQSPVTAELVEGAFSVTLLPSDSPDWASPTGDIPYIITEKVDGRVSKWMTYINGAGPIDIKDLIPLDQAPDHYIPVPGPPGPDGAMPAFYNEKAGPFTLSQVWQPLIDMILTDVAIGTYETGFDVSWITDNANDRLLLRSRVNRGAWSVYSKNNTDILYWQNFFVQFPQDISIAGHYEVELEARLDGTGAGEAKYVDLWARRVR